MTSARLNRRISLDDPSPNVNPPNSKLTLGDIPIPAVDDALIEYLETAFAPVLSHEKDLRDYDRMLGHKEVIEHLRALSLPE